jgi:hypothetical protein
VLSGGGGGERPESAGDEEEVLIRRWLRIADDMVRRERGKIGGRREDPERKPVNERRDGPTDLRALGEIASWLGR